MSTQRFFGGKFNGADMAQTQQRSTHESAVALIDGIIRVRDAARDDDYDPSLTRIGNPALVLRLDRGYDVVSFAPYRRLNESPLTRAQAEALCRRSD